MAQKKTVRFGLLGAGLIASFHAKSIQAAESCELVAVADLNAERAASIAKEFDCAAYCSLDELLADETIDVINILTPNHLHCDVAVAAAHAGKGVLVEKPPAMSLKETDAMIQACTTAGVKLGVVLQCRVRRPIQAIKQAVTEGRFGRLLQADTYMKWHRTIEYYLADEWHCRRSSGAGVTIMHAFHYIDLLQYIMGPVKKVQARMNNLAHPEVELEDTLNAFVDYKNGAQGVVVASTALWPGTDIRIEINGENGTAIMSGEQMILWKFKDDRPEDEEIRSLGRDSVATAASGPADFDFADHQVIIEGMARAVREDVAPIITADSARDTLEVALAMYQSAKRGQPVELPITNEQEIWQ